MGETPQHAPASKRPPALNWLLLGLAVPVLATAQAFTVETVSDTGVEVIRLTDHNRGIEVTVVPSLGNRAIEMKVHGKNILFVPEGDLAGLKQKPGLNGVPFLAPWANRLDEAGFWADEKHYTFNASLHNFGSDNNGLPIHGLLASSNLWRVAETKADSDSAWVTSRLEFWKYPDLMAQWPFAHEYEMTYRLAGGALEVQTSVTNLSAEPMPVVLGFHPYYRLPDTSRDEWTLSMPSAKAVVTDSHLIPTGELKPSDLPERVALKGRNLDNGYTALQRDEAGKAHFRLESGTEALEIVFGPRYPVAVIWEPPSSGKVGHEFVCIEPMTSVTNGVNLNHRKLYDALQTLRPGERWTESFWIKPNGF